MQRGRPIAAGLFVLVCGSYVGAAKVGINLDVAHGVITPVWAPSGIALAALLILGLRYWPAVAVGAFIANVTSDASVAVAAGIAIGNTLEPVVGAGIVRRVGFRPQLDRVRTVVALTAGAAAFSTAIAATSGVSVLTLAGERQDSFLDAWVLWWFGDAVGVLMVAPLLLVLYGWRRVRLSPRQMAEGAALVAAVTAVSALVFLGGAWRYPYLLFPLLLWGALRFHAAGAAAASFIVGALGTWGAIAGEIPIGADTPTERVQVAQALFALVAVSLLVVGATLAEREAGNAELARTAALLGEAQALAHIGHWTWDIRRDAVTWSDELYRIFGLSPAGEKVDYPTYLKRLHPEDREFADRAIQRAFEERRPFAFEHRVVRPDGVERIVAGRGRVIVENDEPVAMLGTAQDVTEQRQAERLRDDILSAVSHELRTLLTSVLGFALTLEGRRDALSGEESARIIGELVGAARRLERLLADLLDVERVRRGVVEVKRTQTDMLDLVERAVAASRLDGRQVDISGAPVIADVDEPKVERIVENLVLNAAKHTPERAAIHVRLDTQGADLLLSVDDEGPGVPDDFKRSVFETFNRGPKMLSTTPGLGIGLALVARFAEVHGGRTWVEDRDGGGASFRVLLPDCVRSSVLGPPSS
jgi:PAS domain S-box-containing protein